MIYGLAGCGGDSPTAPQAPPPPAVTVSFEPGPLEVIEGDTAEIRIRYQVRSLDTPWQLGISSLPVTASADDFELSATGIEIPAGQGVSGEASLEVAAAEDIQFDEGDETVAVRFVPGGGVNARLGTELQVAIQDAGVSPCAGLRVVATRPGSGGPADSLVQRSFTFRITESHGSLAAEFLGPYRESSDEVIDGLPELNSQFGINVAAWKVVTDGQNVEHTMDLQMRREAFGDPDLQLAFRGEECDTPQVTCSVDSCELNP